MTEILVKVGSRRPVYAVTELLQQDYLIRDNTTNHHDPHVWMDIRGWSKAVEVIAKALADLDPANAAFFRENAAAYLSRLREVETSVSDKNIKTLIEGAALPADSKCLQQ
jgi:manganese/zinc/iron transport system substrate-binding protein